MRLGAVQGVRTVKNTTREEIISLITGLQVSDIAQEAS